MVINTTDLTLKGYFYLESNTIDLNIIRLSNQNKTEGLLPKNRHNIES